MRQALGFCKKEMVGNLCVHVSLVPVICGKLHKSQCEGAMGGYYRMLLRAMPGGRLGITVRRWGLCKVRKSLRDGLIFTVKWALL